MKKFLSVWMILSLLLVLMAGCKKPDAESGAPAEVIENSAGDQPGDAPEQQVHLPNQPAEQPIETPLAVEDLTAEVSYDESWPMQEPDAKFISGQMNFSVELFRRVAAKERCKNTLISPFSVSMALAMAANGADGQTAEEMQKVLGGHSVEELNAYFGNWYNALKNTEQAELHIANSIWIRNERGFEAKEPFLANNAKFYRSQVFKAPFNHIGVQKVNEWIDANTDGMIPQMLQEIRPETMMLLINALAFDAEWAEPYEEYQVRPEVFHSLEGEEQEAEMLGSSEHHYLEGEGVAGFYRTYKGGKYAFGALLPAEGTFEDYIEGFSGEELLSLLENEQSTEVHVQLPKFKKDYSATLNEILMDMGMPSAFEGGFANMSNEDLYIGEVLHKTLIEVHEGGTRAAAATIISMDKATAMVGEEPKVLKLDRPFIYFIFDQDTKLPLFIGTLTSLE